MSPLVAVCSGTAALPWCASRTQIARAQHERRHLLNDLTANPAYARWHRPPISPHDDFNARPQRSIQNCPARSVGFEGTPLKVQLMFTATKCPIPSKEACWCHSVNVGVMHKSCGFTIKATDRQNKEIAHKEMLTQTTDTEDNPCDKHYISDMCVWCTKRSFRKLLVRNLTYAGERWDSVGRNKSILKAGTRRVFDDPQIYSLQSHESDKNDECKKPFRC